MSRTLAIISRYKLTAETVFQSESCTILISVVGSTGSVHINYVSGIYVKYYLVSFDKAMT